MQTQWDDNQGVINGRVMRLLDKPDELAAFVAKLTDKQREAARAHVKTVYKLRRQNDMQHK